MDVVRHHDRRRPERIVQLADQLPDDAQRDRVELAREAAVASLPKPYSPAQMLAAVDFLFRLQDGRPSLEAPDGLSVFRPMPTDGDARPLTPAA